MSRAPLYSKLKLFGLARQAGIVFLSAGLLTACSSPEQAGSHKADNQAGTKTDKGSDVAQKRSSDAIGSEDDLDDLDDSLKAKKKGKETKPQVSTTGPVTGKLEDAVIVQQQNEFLGVSTLKLSNDGIRLESSTLLVIMPPGKEAVAYNSQNGNCMQLTAKSRSLLAGNSNFSEQGKQLSTKVGTETIAGLHCIHYKLHKILIDSKTGKESDAWDSELWTTKDLKLSSKVMNDCARITMMPVDLGFPVKITRSARTTRSEHRNGVRGGESVREVVSTSSFTREKIDKGQFAFLPGFKSVTDEMQLMMASDDDSELAGGSILDDDKDPVAKTN